MARLGWLVLASVLLFQLPGVVASYHGPAIESADPAPGSYTMASPGGFPVEVECADDPDGDDVYVDFVANGRVIETDEDLWGFSPSYTFSLPSGTHSLQARCRDTAGAMGTPSSASWTVQVAGASAPPAQNGAPSVERSTPQAGPHSLQGAGGFEVEVECTDDPEGGAVFVEFIAGSKVVETDEDLLGFSPSYTFQLGVGTFDLAARCRDSAGTASAMVLWTVTVVEPRGGTTEIAGAPATCSHDLADPAVVLADGRVADALLASPDLWHRTGPWTCTLADLAGPVTFARDLDREFVDFKATLEDAAMFGVSAWDGFVRLVPAAPAVWAVFEGALPILDACAVALGGIDAFAEVRSAAIAYLSSEIDGATLRAMLEQTLPAYHAWVGAFDAAAAEVAAWAVTLTDVAAYLLQAADELDAGSWFPFRDTMVGLLRGLHSVAVAAADAVAGWSVAIRAIADPVRSDIQVMTGILHDSKDTPAWSLTLTLAVLAALAFARGRKR